MKKTFILTHAEARLKVAEFAMKAPEGLKVTFSQQTRSLDQNSLLWPLLTAFSKNLKWTVNGEQILITPEDWKDILTASFRLVNEHNPIRVTTGVNGGMVILGTRTSTMGKREFSDFLEFIYATAAERGLNLERAHAL